MYEFFLCFVLCIECLLVCIFILDVEFYLFLCQVQCWQEVGVVKIEVVLVEFFDIFEECFIECVVVGEYDFVYVSYVVFNFGFVFEWFDDLVGVVFDEVFFVFDGYYSFMVLLFDWSVIEECVFYFFGGYKYVMVGEGCCFLICFLGIGEWLVNMGWYSVFGDLQKLKEFGVVFYVVDGMCFFGLIFDFSGFY